MTFCRCVFCFAGCGRGRDALPPITIPLQAAFQRVLPPLEGQGYVGNGAEL
ncbi:hypothetical protein [Insolitispirillum peregrinum]|uniref:hypothetical protein n=1 Tax=Insolitispirillum peregrinum TaxID=80876 RepID=UPI0036D43735